MKSDPEKKGKSPKGSKSRAPESVPSPERSGTSQAETGESSAKAKVTAGRGGSGAAKLQRRNRAKQTPPPVRIVSDLPTGWMAVSRDEAIGGESDGEVTEPGATDTISREHIAERAYELYVSGGYEPGKEEEHWLEAERQLKEEQRRNR